MSLLNLDTPGEERDIAVSTRIRLARNLKGTPFPARLTPSGRIHVFAKVCGAFKLAPFADDFQIINLQDLSDAEASSLMEQRLISPELLSSSDARGVILSQDRKISVMVNEEDHIRIQVIGQGMCLESCLKAAMMIDSAFESNLRFAFDERLGYLTSCPTNLGTGLRAGVMMHLPALTETGLIHSIIEAAGKLSIAIRGGYGEGSAAKGALYQISNQNTLGASESDLCDMLRGAIIKIIAEERQTRKRLFESNPHALSDRVWRSAGILRNARLISFDEASENLSGLRLGLSLGIIDGVDFNTINAAMDKIPPATVTLLGGGDLPASRDWKRAEILRGMLAE